MYSCIIFIEYYFFLDGFHMLFVKCCFQLVYLEYEFSRDLTSIARSWYKQQQYAERKGIQLQGSNYKKGIWHNWCLTSKTLISFKH